MEDTIREILIDYHIKTNEFAGVDAKIQRLWAEEHVDKYLKNAIVDPFHCQCKTKEVINDLQGDPFCENCGFDVV